MRAGLLRFLAFGPERGCLRLPRQTWKQEKTGRHRAELPGRKPRLWGQGEAGQTGRCSMVHSWFCGFCHGKPHKYHSEKLYTVLNLGDWVKYKTKNPPFFRWACYTEANRYGLRFSAKASCLRWAQTRNLSISEEDVRC